MGRNLELKFMAYPLTKPVSRETKKHYQGLPVILTIAPAGAQDEALIGLRLKGKRTEYILALSDAYRYAALAYGNRVKAAKREARRLGVSWRQAKKKFDAQNKIQRFTQNPAEPEN